MDLYNNKNSAASVTATCTANFNIGSTKSSKTVKLAVSPAVLPVSSGCTGCTKTVQTGSGSIAVSTTNFKGLYTVQAALKENRQEVAVSPALLPISGVCTGCTKSSAKKWQYRRQHYQFQVAVQAALKDFSQEVAVSRRQHYQFFFFKDLLS